jgi:hypothetical protein
MSVHIGELEVYRPDYGTWEEDITSMYNERVRSMLLATQKASKDKTLSKLAEDWGVVLK